DETTTRLDELHPTEQQNNEAANLWSGFVEGSDCPISNEENGLLDLDRSFDSDIPIVEVEFIPLQPNPLPIDNEAPQVEDIPTSQDEDSSSES
ncbi:12701_t:CDS:1, partial [Ambispora gerdemannii]